MKKLLFLLFFAVALTASAFTPPDGINGDARNRIIIINSHTSLPHLAEPAVAFATATSTLEVEFLAPPAQYVVTVTNMTTGIFLTDYSCTGEIPLPTNGFGDFLITVEVDDELVFEGTLYAADYAPYLNPWI